ncbi:MAG: radical SAM/SPASM domain-containing protein [Desulfovibrionaceae bacterium]
MSPGRLQLVSDILRRKGPALGLRCLANLALHKADTLLPRLRLPHLPSAMDIEVASVCNLRCPGCIHGHKDGHYILPRPKFMRLDAFRRILTEAGPGLLHVNMTPLGEAFLNPDIYDIIRLAKRYGIRLTVDTNGHVIDAARTVDSGLDEITFAVDGFSQQSYATYRRGGRLDVVLRNLEALAREAARQGSRMQINAKYFVNRFTEPELDAARRHFAGMPGVSFFESYFLVPPPDWAHYRSDPYSTTAELHDQWAPVGGGGEDLYYRDEASGLYRQITQRMPFQENCSAIRDGLYITTNGDAYPCCKAAALETPALYLGNVLKDGVRAVHLGDAARTIRAAYARAGGRYSICATCWVNRAKGNRARHINPEFSTPEDRP